MGRDEAGIRWQEYVAPDDLDYLLQWFAGLEAGEMGGHAVFRMLIPISRRWVCCIWSKERLRGDWLVVGETIEVTDLPVPTGVAEAISQAGEVAASDDEEMKENEEKTEGGGGGGGGGGQFDSPRFRDRGIAHRAAGVDACAGSVRMQG